MRGKRVARGCETDRREARCASARARSIQAGQTHPRPLRPGLAARLSPLVPAQRRHDPPHLAATWSLRPARRHRRRGSLLQRTMSHPIRRRPRQKSSSQDAPPPPRDPPPLAMERPTQWGMRWGQSPPAGRPALAAATPGASRTGPCWMKSSDGANANCCRCSSAPRRNRVARKEGRPEKGANASPAPVAWCVSCMLPANGVCTGMETCDEECVRCKVRQSKVKNATREGAGRSPRTGRIPGRSADFVKKKQIVFDQPCWARAGLGRCIERSRKDCAVAIRSAWDQPRMLIAGIRHLLSML